MLNILLQDILVQLRPYTIVTLLPPADWEPLADVTGDTGGPGGVTTGAIIGGEGSLVS